MSLDEIADEVQGKRIEKEEPVPGPREYVKIKGIWQHTQMSWWVDKEKMNMPNALGIGVSDWQCVAHVHHWKTELEEFCRVELDWKCVRCGDVVPESIQSMI